jgi:hypothetical protein
MKRNPLLAGCLGLAVVLGPAFTSARGDEPSAHDGPAATTPCPAADAARSREDKLVADLIDYLGETDSMEAYTLTCMVLAKMGNTALPALPAIIRNAERLHLFEDSLNPEATGAKRDVSEAVGKCIKLILAKKRDKGHDLKDFKDYPHFPPSPAAATDPLRGDQVPTCTPTGIEAATPTSGPTPAPPSPGSLKSVPDVAPETMWPTTTWFRY